MEEILSILKWMLRGYIWVFAKNLVTFLKTDIKNAYVKERKKVFGMH